LKIELYSLNTIHVHFEYKLALTKGEKTTTTTTS